MAWKPLDREPDLPALPDGVTLVDSHCHLDLDFDADRSEVLARARAAGIGAMVTIGASGAFAANRAAVALAAAHDAIQATVGVHPHEAASVTDAVLDTVAELATRPKVVAIGETGLDYDRAFSPRADQLANLRRHLELAWELCRPLILHCRSRSGERDAQDALLAELAAAGVGDTTWAARLGGRPPAVLHSFSGPVDYAERALAMGCVISFSGLVFRRGEEASALVARLVPEALLLTETDSPYLSPPGAPRRRNEPRWVEVTARWLAEQRRADPEALGEAVVVAYDRLIGRSPRPG